MKTHQKIVVPGENGRKWGNIFEGSIIYLFWKPPRRSEVSWKDQKNEFPSSLMGVMACRKAGRLSTWHSCCLAESFSADSAATSADARTRLLTLVTFTCCELSTLRMISRMYASSSCAKMSCSGRPCQGHVAAWGGATWAPREAAPPSPFSGRKSTAFSCDRILSSGSSSLQAEGGQVALDGVMSDEYFIVKVVLVVTKIVTRIFFNDYYCYHDQS